MADEAGGRLARLRAFASEGGIAWPEGEGVRVRPGVMGGDPCLVGTRWPVSIWRDYACECETPEAAEAAILASYDWLTAEQVAVARAYCERYAALFEADCWRSYLDNEAFPGPEGDQRERLTADVRALLAERDALAAQLGTLPAASREVGGYYSIHPKGGVVDANGNDYEGRRNAIQALHQILAEYGINAARTGRGEG